MNSLCPNRLVFIAMLPFVFSASLGLGERLGACGLSPSGAACEAKSLQVFRVARTIISNALITCGQMSFMGGKDCVEDSTDEDLALDIGTAIKKNEEGVRIEFKSESESPGFFVLDGQVRIAKTGSNPNDVIYINCDMALANQTEILDAVAILSHELGHHFGVKDHQRLDAFGARIKQYLIKFQISASEIFPSSGGDDQLAELWAFNLWNLMSGAPMFPVDGNTVIIVWDGSDYIDLTTEFLPKLCEPGTRLKAFSVKGIGFGTPEANSLKIAAPLSYYCMPDNGFGRLNLDKNAHWQLPVKKQHDRVIIDDEHISWELKKCHDDRDLGCRP